MFNRQRQILDDQEEDELINLSDGEFDVDAKLALSLQKMEMACTNDKVIVSALQEELNKKNRNRRNGNRRNIRGRGNINRRRRKR